MSNSARSHSVRKTCVYWKSKKLGVRVIEAILIPRNHRGLTRFTISDACKIPKTSRLFWQRRIAQRIRRCCYYHTYFAEQNFCLDLIHAAGESIERVNREFNAERRRCRAVRLSAARFLARASVWRIFRFMQIRCTSSREYASRVKADTTPRLAWPHSLHGYWISICDIAV